jgi:4-diphosphocytidyl-2-C-methyl-D-erythritol kinase
MLQPRSLLLAVPPYGVATADAYRWLDEARSTIPDLGEGVATAERWGWELISELSTNDFEPVVEQRHPQLRGYRERLRAAGASIARLSGSGSTVFGVFNGDVPDPRDLALDALVLRTRTSTRVVQVEVQE